MAQGRIICCCGALTWAKVMGWVQIILYALAVILSILMLVEAIQAKPYTYADKTAVVIIWSVDLLIQLLGLAFSIILVVGANKKRPAYLCAWIVYTVISILWLGLGASVLESVAERVPCIIKILLYCFGIFVVDTLKKEIKEEMLT